MFYLQPDYDAEFVYIPENREHPIYDGLSESEGLVGLVETRVTLTDPINGVGKVCAYHVAFTQQEHEHDIAFEDGVGIFYRNPDYKVRSITLENGSTYMVEAADGEKGLTVENRIQYAKLGDILNVPVQGEVDVRFTESDKSLSPPERVVVNENFPPENGDFGSVPVNDGEVTVFRDSDGDGYKIAYSLSSNTYADTSVAQFALHSGQTITIDQIPAGATYYIYEYAVGDGDRNISDWDTTITASDNGEVIAEYRAAKGTIVLNAAQSVAFPNAAHVGQLSISKTVAGAQATADDRQKEFTFTLTLEDSNGNPLQGTYPYTGATVEGAEGAPAPQNGVLTLNANGSATVALSHGQCITITQIPDGATYAVSETPNDGYKVVVEGDTDSNLVAEGEIQTNQTAEVDFTNIKLSQFSFTKVAAEDHTQALPSAEFQVFSLQCTNDGHDHSKDLIDPDSPGGCWTYLGTWTSDDEGAVAFGGLQPSSQYQLVETKAPGGRVLSRRAVADYDG